jgi:hypothetical protein
MRSEYEKLINDAVKEGVISKSYKNSCIYGFCFQAGYGEREPFMSIKNEFLEKKDGTEAFRVYIDRKIIQALLSERRISESASERLLGFIASKIAAADSAWASRALPKNSEPTLRPKGQCRVCGSLDTKRSSQILEEGTSSTVGFGVGSSGSLAVGVGFSKTAQAKKAQELRNKGLAESYDGYNKLTRERSIVALISPLFILLGPVLLTASIFGREYTRKLDIGAPFALFLYFAVAAVVYFSLPFIFRRYGDKELYEKSYVFGYSADYWKCLRCGHSWDENK